ncbi:putative neural-cadherin 2 [Scylla paramamosain]|uniref:putative neural-cadherin 2 n=1 Tax=Scylla paramamosain TaxID=85552 RepID=UPI00308292BE
MDPAKILQIITNSTWMVTKLVGEGPVEFTHSQYVIHLPENTRIPPSRPLLQLSVRLHAPGEKVSFRIKEGNEEGRFFLHPSTGVLSLQRPLDYEETQQCELVVEVRGSSGEGSQARVLVQVGDRNEHAPYFPRALHETQITEEDDRHLPKTVLTVSAVDGDAGGHGRLVYSLSGDGVHSNSSLSYFSVDPATGALSLLKPLDRDPPTGRSQWRLQVGVSDGHSQAVTVVLVNVKDINDNAPFFPEETLHASVPENSPKGTKVTQVQATDHDDPNEGTNARLIYSLEKNVIDEATGRPIFTVDGKEGVISTSICCLDREKAQRYTIQVVATDGGGLKGTGTVLVEVEDVNDTPPRFPQQEWVLAAGEHLTPDHPLGELGVVDQDLNNQFSFRVVPESGRGWQLFRVGAGGVGGLLWARQPLDYENPAHRVGFRFRVEVTDRGEDGWHFPHNTDSTWVSLHLQDANDNPPTFTSAHAHLSLPEDTPPGSYLASFPAHDDDGGGDGKVDYSVAPDTDPGGLFSVSEAGVVQLARELDREAAEVHRVLVEAVDRGTPPRTATATLLVNVTDVNDNPPYLSEPRQVRVPENVGPREVARVHLSDLDVWGQGHGPPFSLHLDPRAPSDVKEAVVVSFNREGDSGRGEGVVSTSRPLDREVTPVLLVPLVVGDAGSLSATVTLTVHVTDMNDNPMAPASRHVTVWVLQPQSEVVPLGRVFVQDPDEGDQSSKTYRWRGAAPPGSSQSGHGKPRSPPRRRQGQLGPDLLCE